MLIIARWPGLEKMLNFQGTWVKSPGFLMYFFILWSKISLHITQFPRNEVPQFPIFSGIIITLNFLFHSTGLGYGMIVIVTLVCCYYNVVISYIIYYLFASFSRVLPWSTCGNSWNTPNCTVSMKEQNIDVNISSYLGNETEYNETYLLPIYQTRPSQEFWE